ncbi:MAG: FAD-dependent oxidoreductase [Actinomycetota bacterium]|nr:FAD-dependent oxidoreductase [Actinomycetota bacterium]
MGQISVMTSKPGHIVVGASAAGVAAAIAIRKAGYAGAISVIDSDPNQLYERPPLSKSLVGGVGDAALKPILPSEIYQSHDIELRLGVGVDALDVDRHLVMLRDGSALAADHVVLATGVTARRLPVPGADLANVLTLPDAADARAVSACLATGGPLVIVGGGFIGLELAAVARENGITVTVIELASLPLIGVTGREVAELVHRLHADRGVQFRLGVSVAAFAGTSVVEGVELNDGEHVPAQTVVVGVGVLSQVALAEAAGLEVDRFGIVVDRFGNTSHPWVSAAGDVASRPHPALATRGRIEHWDVAQRHGAAVGASIAGTATPFDATPYAWSDQYGLMLQMFVRAHPGDEIVLRRGGVPERFLAFWLRDGRVGAIAGLDSAREVDVGKRLIEARVPLDAAQLQDPDLDLRQLLKNATRAPSRP